MEIWSQTEEDGKGPGEVVLLRCPGLSASSRGLSSVLGGCQLLGSG